MPKERELYIDFLDHKDIGRVVATCDLSDRRIVRYGVTSKDAFQFVMAEIRRLYPDKDVRPFFDPERCNIVVKLITWGPNERRERERADEAIRRSESEAAESLA